MAAATIAGVVVTSSLVYLKRDAPPGSASADSPPLPPTEVSLAPPFSTLPANAGPVPGSGLDGTYDGTEGSDSRVLAYVLEVRGGPAQLCFALFTSSPPSCGSPWTIENWTWPPEGSESSSEVRWGDFVLTGRWDVSASTFRLTQQPRSPSASDSARWDHEIDGCNRAMLAEPPEPGNCPTADSWALSDD
jgi:hypothetical protein